MGRDCHSKYKGPHSKVPCYHCYAPSIDTYGLNHRKVSKIGQTKLSANFLRWCSTPTPLSHPPRTIFEVWTAGLVPVVFGPVLHLSTSFLGTGAELSEYSSTFDDGARVLVLEDP